jgi:hypothetical protein
MKEFSNHLSGTSNEIHCLPFIFSTTFDQIVTTAKEGGEREILGAKL